jgi:hypothetical protein
VPTIPLAIYDFVPVAVTALGLYWVWRAVAAVSSPMGPMALAGSILVVLGGASKALWKLVLAVSSGSVDPTWLSDSLFVLMAPGFVLLAAAVWAATRDARGLSARAPHTIGPVVAVATLAVSGILATLLPGSPAWSRVLLSVMVVAVLVLNALLVAVSVRQRSTPATVLLAFNIVGTLALNAMARVPVQSVSLQWVEQTVNAASWLAFTGAAYLIYQRLGETPDDPAAREALSGQTTG